MSKAIHFISGLPRAGSTVLYNILAQNPRIHVSSPGGILSVVFLVRNRWNRMVNFRATPNETGKERVLQAILDGYYEDVDKPVIFDRSLGALGMLETIEKVLGRNAKVLVCVRDVRDVLATFEVNWQKDGKMQEMLRNHPQKPKLETPQDRCAFFAAGDQPMGLAYNQIKDALARGFRDRLHFVVFEKLMAEPRQTMKGIYEFIGETEFEHNFENLQQVIWENYAVYGIPERHQIPPRLVPLSPLWPRVLGEAAHRYNGQQLW